MIQPAFEHIPAAVFSTRKLLGYSQGFAERFFPDPSGKPPSFTLNTFLGDRNVAVAREMRQLPAGASRDYELRIGTPKGDATFQVSCRIVETDGDRVVNLVFHDVHALVTRVRALEESESRARVLVETRSAAMALVRDGRFLHVNRGFTELFGYMMREDLIGQEVGVIGGGRDRKTVGEYAQRPLEADTPPERCEINAVRKDGGKLHVQILDELIEPDGEPARLWYVVDITHLRTAQQDVQRDARQNEVLQHILESLHRSVDRPTLVREALRSSLRWFGYEAGAMLVVDAKRAAFVLEHQENLSEKLSATLGELGMTEGFGGFMVKTMEPVRFAIAEYPAYLPYRALFEAEGVKRMLCLPLGGEAGAVGMILLFSMKESATEGVHAAFLGTAAHHLGFALDKAVRYASTNERAENLATALEALSGIVYETAPNGVLRYLSPAVERITGYTVGEVMRSPDSWRAMVHPDDRPVISERITRQSGADDAFVLEYRVLPKGKASYLRVHDAVRYRRDANGQVAAVHGFVLVVADREEQPAAAPPPGDMTRGVVDAMSDAVMVTDLEGRIMDVNSAFTVLTGYARTEAMGRSLPYPWLEEEQMAAFVQWLTTLRETQRVTDFDMRWVRRDGAGIAISVSTTLLRNAAGEPVAILNIARDINERQRIGEEIRQANRQLSVLNAIGLGLTGAVDARTVLGVVHSHLQDAIGYGAFAYERFDRHAGTLTCVYCEGVPCDATLTCKGGDVASAPVRVEDDPQAAAVVESGEPWQGVVADGTAALIVPVVTKADTLGIIRLLRPDAFTGGDLRIAASIATLVAIALERVALHEATVAGAREIARRNEELDRFAYVVSHDLKEPLITISGYTKLAIEGGGARMSEDVRQHLESVLRAGARLKQLIDDLLTLARVARAEGPMSGIPARQVLTDLVRDLEYLLLDRQASVEFEPALPAVPYDPTHLAMVFRNLIVNGIRYNTADRPVVRITATEDAEAWSFAVADNGVGIDPAYFEKIFMIFQRLNPADGVGGTGAGLTIVKKIVESYGGIIRVASEPGKGSTFTFTIPKHD